MAPSASPQTENRLRMHTHQAALDIFPQEVLRPFTCNTFPNSEGRESMEGFKATLKKNEPAVRRSALLALLYLILSFQAMLPIEDPDIWWHLRAGQWIVDNRAVPARDFLSSMEKPWIAYSWSFEALVYALHARFGLSGLV